MQTDDTSLLLDGRVERSILHAQRSQLLTLVFRCPYSQLKNDPRFSNLSSNQEGQKGDQLLIVSSANYMTNRLFWY